MRVHFASDLAGSVAVLVGLLLARAGHPDGDAVAALFVAVLVLAAAARLMRGNVDVLMDRAPAGAEAAARDGDRGARPGGRAAAAADAAGGRTPVRRRRDRRLGRLGRSARATRPPTRSRQPLQRALPGSDVVVHVEPGEDATRASAPTRRPPRCPACGRSTTSASSSSTAAASSRSTSSSRATMTLAEAHEVAEQRRGCDPRGGPGARRGPDPPRAAERALRGTRGRSPATRRSSSGSCAS